MLSALLSTTTSSWTPYTTTATPCLNVGSSRRGPAGNRTTALARSVEQGDRDTVKRGVTRLSDDEIDNLAVVIRDPLGNPVAETFAVGKHCCRKYFYTVKYAGHLALTLPRWSDLRSPLNREDFANQASPSSVWSMSAIASHSARAPFAVRRPARVSE